MTLPTSLGLDQVKGRARRLRSCLSDMGITLSHAQSLEVLSKEEGFRDWNTFSAHIGPARLRQQQPVQENGCPFAVGDRISGIYRGGAFTGTILGLEVAGRGDVWRTKIHFDAPVSLDMGEHLNLTRQRVRTIINRLGQSVNLAGTPDGWVQIGKS